LSIIEIVWTYPTNATRVTGAQKNSKVCQYCKERQQGSNKPNTRRVCKEILDGRSKKKQHFTITYNFFLMLGYLLGFNLWPTSTHFKLKCFVVVVSTHADNSIPC